MEFFYERFYAKHARFYSENLVVSAWLRTKKLELVDFPPGEKSTERKGIGLVEIYLRLNRRIVIIMTVGGHYRARVNATGR